MRALKILVAVMGVMLMVGLAILVTTIINRATQQRQASAPNVALSANFGHTELTLPAGAHVVEMSDAGGRLVLRLQRQDGSEALLILDPATGTVLGTIELKPGP